MTTSLTADQVSALLRCSEGNLDFTCGVLAAMGREKLSFQLPIAAARWERSSNRYVALRDAADIEYRRGDDSLFASICREPGQAENDAYAQMARDRAEFDVLWSEVQALLDQAAFECTNHL